jgi:hypothetical protein
MGVPPSNKNERVIHAPVRKALFVPDSTQYMDASTFQKLLAGLDEK